MFKKNENFFYGRRKGRKISSTNLKLVEDFSYTSGVTVSDDISLGSNTLSWTGTLNLAVVGSYDLVYSITDLAGNVSTKLRRTS